MRCEGRYVERLYCCKIEGFRDEDSEGDENDEDDEDSEDGEDGEDSI